MMVVILITTPSEIQPTDGHCHSHPHIQLAKIHVTGNAGLQRGKGVWELQNDMVPKTALPTSTKLVVVYGGMMNQ